MQVDDTRPIWVQLIDELTHRIVAGDWPPGARIPSVRDLAAEAGVNPNTVQRSLAALDAAGLTVTERTAGRFVTSDTATITAARQQMAAAATDAYIATLTGLGTTSEEAHRLLETRWSHSPEGDPR